MLSFYTNNHNGTITPPPPPPPTTAPPPAAAEWGDRSSQFGDCPSTTLRQCRGLAVSSRQGLQFHFSDTTTDEPNGAINTFGTTNAARILTTDTITRWFTTGRIECMGHVLAAAATTTTGWTFGGRHRHCNALYAASAATAAIFFLTAT